MTTPDAGQRLIEDLRNLSSKANQLVGAMRMMSLWPEIPQDIRDLLTADGPDLMTRAADEIVRLRAIAASRSTGAADVGEDHG